MDGRSGGGSDRDQPRGEDGSTRDQSVPGGGGHEGLSQRAEAGEDWPESPGTRVMEIYHFLWSTSVGLTGSVFQNQKEASV